MSFPGMSRGDVWWCDFPSPAGRRPAVLLSRQSAYATRTKVTVAPVSTRTRPIPAEVHLGPTDGLPRSCSVNLDSLITIEKNLLDRKITTLSSEKLEAVDQALRYALGLPQ